MKFNKSAIFLRVTNLLLIILFCNSGFLWAEKIFMTDDATYEDNIKTVLLYPTENGTDLRDMINPPLMPMAQTSFMKLEFDELGSDYQNYFIKIINCNADWSLSQLNAIQYLNEFNEYQITDRQISFNTRFPYIHYKINLPKIKITGNYLVMVYRNSDEKDFIITKRFVLYDNAIGIKMDPKFPLSVSDRNSGQQIDFMINYGQYNLINPLQNLKVILRQNHRWDNAITGLKPVFFNESAGSLEYYFSNSESSFKGYNEFRFFDIRSNRFNGLNVAKATFDADKTEIILRDDANKSTQPYSLIPDFMDGKYIIQNYESGDSEIQPDYVFVTFVLNAPKAEGRVYLIGALTNWRTDRNYEMKYNTAINKYTCRVLLKQGQYNYRYTLVPQATESKDESFFEGSYNLTQNIYDILVYYRPFGALSDQVIGYQSINYQGR
jgi:hypothetical protein